MLGLGTALVLVQLLVQLLSERFAFDADFASTALFGFVAIQIFAGIIYLISVRSLPVVETSQRMLVLVIALGLAMRLLLFGSTPILEVDYYRYLWDGAAVANGFNPYLLAPLEVPGSSLNILSQQAAVVFDRINYPELRTIYPPLTQGFFALAYWFDSWSLDAWRLVLLVADCIGFALILRVLKSLQKPAIWGLIYWWNPLLLQQTYNAAHMDVLLVAPLVATVWLLLHHRHLLASLTLGLAAGIKLWPLLLLPFTLRPLLSRPGHLLFTLGLTATLLTLLVAPLIYFGLGENSGLGAFAQQWQRNSAIFPLIQSISGTFTDNAALLSRLLIAAILLGTTLCLNWKAEDRPERLIRNMLIVVALLFLLSPAQFPWYSIWFLPLLCFQRNYALLLLTVLMPLYYLKFYFVDQGTTEIFDTTIVWLQYLPVLILLALPYLPKFGLTGWQTKQT